MSPDDNDSILFRRAPRALPRAKVRRLAEQLRREVVGQRRFTCLLTDDRELRRLNRQFLGRDYPTDVLAFPGPAAGDPGSEPGEPFLGEIAISVERAREQAAERGHGWEEEIGILMLHGLLHLLGMDHATDHGRMRRAETRWRKKLGLPGGLIERARS